ncbi:MAG: adenylyl-sulfate kinase [Cyclobacteriaceae bacterium]
MVVLITGKANAGKTYYAVQLINELKDSDTPIAHIDGDIWRQQTENNDYSDKGRYKNLMQAARKAAEYERLGYLVVCSFVSPKKKWRDAMRCHWKESIVMYIPGGELWPGTEYERPDFNELQLKKS